MGFVHILISCVSVKSKAGDKHKDDEHGDDDEQIEDALLMQTSSRSFIWLQSTLV